MKRRLSVLRTSCRALVCWWTMVWYKTHPSIWLHFSSMRRVWVNVPLEIILVTGNQKAVNKHFNGSIPWISRDDFHIEVLKHFAHMHDFFSMDIVEALRYDRELISSVPCALQSTSLVVDGISSASSCPVKHRRSIALWKHLPSVTMNVILISMLVLVSDCVT